VVSQSSRPHDSQSQGVVGGEAAATIVIEHADYAKNAGRPALAKLVSYASRFVASSGQRGSARAIEMAIAAAMKDANVSSDQIGLVVSHGMGDPQIDAAERDALQATVPNCPVTAPISLVGHTGSACGAIGLVTAVLSLQHGLVPPTLRTATTAEIGFCDQPSPLDGDFVLAISHTSQGSATAILLGRG
jgi:3-oxoacyl-[acyl-carrier-protein] synthase II